MDKFVVRFSSSEEALPRSWKESPIPTSKPNRTVGRPRKRLRDDGKEEEQSTEKKSKVEPETVPNYENLEKNLIRDAEKEDTDRPGAKRVHYITFTVKQKLEAVDFAKQHGIRAAARHFKLPKSSICNWMKFDFSQNTTKLGHLARSGRPITYGEELDTKIAKWVLVQRDLQIPVTIDGICAYAKELVVNEEPDVDFKASRTWASSFMKRHNLVLRARTSMAQRLPADLEDKISSFHQFVAKKRDDDEFDDSMIINMDETPMYFDLVPGKTVEKKGAKSVRIRTTGAEKRHLTIVLAVSAAGEVLPPMIVFKGVRELKGIKIPKDWVVTVQKKAWMDETLMLRWIQEVYLKHTQKERSLLIMDSFRAHKTEPVKKALRKGNVVPAVIPGGCTSKLQPLDVSINKPVKAELRKHWTNFIRKAAEKLAKNEDCTSTIKAADKQTVINWIDDAIKSLKGKPELVKKSFKVCGISNHRNGCEDHLVRSDDLEPSFDSDDEEDVEFDGFDSEDLRQALAKLATLHDGDDIDNN